MGGASVVELLEGLTTAQQEAVQHVDGPLLMLAGPGSGKTRVVTHRIAYLLHQGISPRNILALTFANKAANEMRIRLERLAGHPSVWMGTFHGFCARFLRRYASLAGLAENYSILDAGDARKAFKRALVDSKVELTYCSPGVRGDGDQLGQEQFDFTGRLPGSTRQSDRGHCGRGLPSLPACFTGFQCGRL